jgi:hypothetical protein
MREKVKCMLQSLNKIYGDKLGATDGHIGHVKDFYFDDQSWAVRYLVADTGSWLPGRQVLIAPHAFTGVWRAEKVLVVNLSRHQIEKSPSIESRKPVSRQYEEEFYRYYGFPFYWQGGGLWGMSNNPVVPLPWKPLATGASHANGQTQPRADAHLRSAQAVKGYQLQAKDGTVGHVCDFLMDDQSWVIAQLVIKTGHRFSGKEVQMPTTMVGRIGYEESTVFVNMTKEAVEQSPAHHSSPAAAVA